MHPIYPVHNEGNIKIQPLSYIKSPIKEPQIGRIAELETEIVLGDDCSNCLDGIEEFSHVVVIYWFNQITSNRKSCCPQRRSDVQLLGMLATR